jgi:hypothetical protein
LGSAVVIGIDTRRVRPPAIFSIVALRYVLGPKISLPVRSSFGGHRRSD